MDTKTIKRIVISETGVDLNNENIVGNRTASYVNARMIYFKLCRDFTKKSLDYIGRSLTPSKNHATVLHGIRSLISDMEYDKNKQSMYNRIRAKVEYVNQKAIEENITYDIAMNRLFYLEDEIAQLKDTLAKYIETYGQIEY